MSMKYILPHMHANTHVDIEGVRVKLGRNHLLYHCIFSILSLLRTPTVLRFDNLCIKQPRKYCFTEVRLLDRYKQTCPEAS